MIFKTLMFEQNSRFAYLSLYKIYGVCSPVQRKGLCQVYPPSDHVEGPTGQSKRGAGGVQTEG